MVCFFLLPLLASPPYLKFSILLRYDKKMYTLEKEENIIALFRSTLMSYKA